MALTRIYIEVDEINPDGSMSLSGYADSSDGDHIFLEDDETMSGMLKKLKPYAVDHGILFIEVQVDMIPDGD